MKNSTLIIVIVFTTFSLTAIGFSNFSKDKTPPKQSTCCNSSASMDYGFVRDFKKAINPNILYDIDARFETVISIDELSKAKSITDIVPKKATQNIVKYYSTRISILDDFRETEQRAHGKNDILNKDQIQLLQTVSYTSNFYIRADFEERNPKTGQLENNYLTYFISVVPENIAMYQGGYESLIEYLKAESKEDVAIVTEDKMKPGQVRFTITETGKIDNVKLLSTSGYESLDQKLVEIITNMPEKWIPASNSAGENVEQDLIFFFGTKGC